MAGIAGWCGYRSGATGSEDLVRAMGAVLARYDNSAIQAVTGDGCALCVAGGENSQAACIRADGLLAAIQGIFSWHDKELDSAGREHGAAHALIRGYRMHGDTVMDLLGGHFSLAIIDEAGGRVLLATDRTASEPLVYSVTGQALLFASSSNAIREHPAAVNDISLQAIFNYLYFHVIPGPGCIYAGHNKLLPGHRLVFDNGRVSVSDYWQLEYREQGPVAGFDDLKEEFLSLVKASVRALSGRGSTGTFLSGGTDSSTVTGMLGEILQRDVPAYSIGFSEEGYDEMEYARIAAGRFRVEHHEYYVTPDDVVDAIPAIAGIYSEPFGNSSAVPAYYCAKLARDDGITTMLAGDGGDELFAGNAHYARQLLFAHYDSIPSFLRRDIIEPLVRSPLFTDRIMPLRKIRRYVEQASMPMPARMESYNLMYALGIDRIFESDFLAAVDTGNPDALMSDRYNSARAGSMLNRMLWLDYKFILADKDLPKVSRMCELAGLDVAYPLLSDELIEFAARIPVSYKLKGQKLRFLFKEALRGFLPDEIITKQKHGFGLPVGLWLVKHERLGQFARDSLNDLKARRIISGEMIDTLLGRKLEEHARFYGPMIWILIMLEQWFVSHGE